jgi:thiol-disulfide isomerase/thioredoxin
LKSGWDKRQGVLKIFSMKKNVLNAFILSIMLALSALVNAQVQRTASPSDSLQRRFSAMIRSNDSSQKEMLKKELYKLTKSKDEQSLTLALRFFDQLQMNATTDSLVNVIKKRFPKGNLAKNTEINVIYNEKDPVKKEAEFQKYLKKFPPEKFTDKIVFDYGYCDVASAYAQAGNSAKAMQYANQLGSPVWRGEGWAIIAASLKGSGDLDSAGELIKRSISNAESFMKGNNQSSDARFVTLGYYSYCSAYADILYRQKRYDESLSYLLKKQNGGRPFDATEKQTYINLLTVLGRNLEAFLTLNELVNSGEAASSDLARFKELYVKLNGSDSGLNELLGALRKKQTEMIKQKLAKEIINLPAPLFTAKDVDGNTVSLAGLKGKVVIVDFWATWCGPCKKSFPAMQMAVDKYKNDENVKFLFIHTWEKEDNPTVAAINYLKENNYSFHLIMDLKDPVTKTNNIVTSYKVTGIPTKFIIDGNGNIRYKIVGSAGNDEAVVEELSAMIESIRK